MKGERLTLLKKAMAILLDQQQAARYFLQSSPNDITVVIPFDGKTIDAWQVKGNDPQEMAGILENITKMSSGGSTDIYSPVLLALDQIRQADPAGYIPAVILMTDGESNTGRSYKDLEATWKLYGKDIPVFLIKFGDASDRQLAQIANLTNGAVFDGRKDLVSAFRKVK